MERIITEGKWFSRGPDVHFVGSSRASGNTRQFECDGGRHAHFPGISCTPLDKLPANITEGSVVVVVEVALFTFYGLVFHRLSVAGVKKLLFRRYIPYGFAIVSYAVPSICVFFVRCSNGGRESLARMAQTGECKWRIPPRSVGWILRITTSSRIAKMITYL